VEIPWLGIGGLQANRFGPQLGPATYRRPIEIATIEQQDESGKAKSEEQ
jgi:hypothetical protein